MGISPQPCASCPLPFAPLLCQYHLLVAVQTGDIDNLCSPNRIPAAGANVLSRAARPRRCGGSRCSVLGVRPGDTETGKLVAVYENVGQACFNNEIYEGFTWFRM